MDKDGKITILTISDDPRSPSGVGTQMKMIIEAWLRSGKFKVISLGGAIRHQDYSVVKFQEFKDDWVIVPTDGFGSQEIVRGMLKIYKPNVLFYFSDPRFYEFLFTIDREVRRLVPMVYHCIWDNAPRCTFNRPWYLSNDLLLPISKLTQRMVTEVAPEVKNIRMPHAVNPEIFKKLPEDAVAKFRTENFNNLAPDNDKKFVFFFNGRNARRKMTGSMIFWFNDFLEKIGKNKACLLLHTDPKDSAGQDLQQIVEFLGLVNGEVLFSRDKITTEAISMLYNLADTVINIADAGGWELSIHESLACETPIIATNTGGMADQISDGVNTFGVSIEPASKAIIGSQQVPWIYEDRVCQKDVVDAMLKMYNMSKSDRDELGRKGREHVDKNFNYSAFCKKWVKVMLDCYEENGSWETRKNYKNYYFKTL